VLLATPLWSPPKNEMAQRWTKDLEAFDGFIFVTAEYNHGIPAVLKNALDYASHQLVRKPESYVGYGGVGAARAIEQLRLVNIGQQMVSFRRRSDPAPRVGRRRSRSS
jgi:NAD(P)H-dependent FMN reductase